MKMRILHSNIRECEYYCLFYVYYFITCDINWRSFYRLIIYYINKNIYCRSSAIKSLMEFWNMNPISPIGLIQLKSESNSNVSPTDVWQLLQTWK